MRDRSRIAIVPAYCEERAIGSVVAEIKAAGLGFDVVVIDDGSPDGTGAAAAAAGAAVVSLPFNLGIGGAVQTGFKYALENGYDLAARRTSTGRRSRAASGSASSPASSRCSSGSGSPTRPPASRR